MDPMLSDLAATGARTILSLMLTDGWNGAKKIVARIFANSEDASSGGLNRELELSRRGLEIAVGTNNPDIQELEMSRWEGNLRRELQRSSEIAELVHQLIEYGRNNAGTASSTSVTLNAHASGNSRIYQQGTGTQHNG